MNGHMVVHLEDLSAHRTGRLFSGDSWNLVWDLGDFPGLSSLWQVLTTKKGLHLLFDTFQGHLLHNHLIINWTVLWQTQCRLCLQSQRSTKVMSGNPGCNLQTLCLFFTGQTYGLLILSVAQILNLPLGQLQVGTLPH